MRVACMLIVYCHENGISQASGLKGILIGYSYSARVRALQYRAYCISRQIDLSAFQRKIPSQSFNNYDIIQSHSKVVAVAQIGRKRFHACGQFPYVRIDLTKDPVYVE